MIISLILLLVRAARAYNLRSNKGYLLPRGPRLLTLPPLALTTVTVLRSERSLLRGPPAPPPNTIYLLAILDYQKIGLIIVIILTTLLKRVVGVVRAARAVIVYVPKSNKGHPPIIKTCLLAPLSLLSLTLTLNTHKLTSKRYPLHSSLALYFRSLPFSTALNRLITRLVIVLIIRTRIVTVVALLITKATF